MGIVLPEGVLNNSNLQKVRDYFESEAKILLITSIPQDVFMASGATIKPSLLFFKRFTEEEKQHAIENQKEALDQEYSAFEQEKQNELKELENNSKRTNI